MPTDDRLLLELDTHAERMVKLRRLIHATPEASGEELATTRLVADTLREAGLEPRILEGGVGVVADLELGGEGAHRIAIRSELDAVGVNDDKQTPYASTRPGLCHACGHDVHTTINLAVATLFASEAEYLRGTGFAHDVRFVFQPAEETATGARTMVQAGVLDGVQSIIALHVDPYLEVGKIGVRKGPITSACKSFRVVISGRGGHSARPHEAVDPVPAAINLVSLFYQLGPRSIDTRSPSVLNVSAIHAGVATNAIPDEAIVSGTLRACRVDDIETIQRRMESIAEGVARATGCDIEVVFLQSCPATDNDSRLIDTLVDVVGETLGPDAVTWLDVPSLGGEDFAFYQELLPGAIVRLGAAVGDPRQRRPLHSSHFDIDEGALLVGAKVLATWAMRLARGGLRRHM